MTLNPPRRAVLAAAMGLGAAALAASSLGLGAAHATGASAAKPLPTPNPTTPPTTPPALPRLAKGVNLSHWFEYERGQGVSAEEFRSLRALGLDHVRIPVDPFVGGWSPERDSAPTFLPELTSAVTQAVAAGLEVVVDLHLEPADKKRIEDHARSEAGLVRLWTQLAAALGHLPHQRLAFELFNEPQYYGAQRRRWPPLQRRLLAAVRAVAPQHLVLLSGSGGGSLEGLTGLVQAMAAPVGSGPSAARVVSADPALAYVFHHYEPFLFTHQGAAWLDERWTTAGLRRGLRYPPDEHTARAPLLREHPRAANELANYVNGGWGAERLRAEMDRAGAWARQHGVRLVCNEFGVIRQHVDEASRYRWLADVRQALQANGIGWTVWDYTDIFGITAQSAQLGQVGRRTLDGPAAAALGLVAGVGVLR